MPRSSVPVTPVTTPRSPHDTPPPSPTTHFDLQSQLNAQLASAVAASQWPQIIDLVHRGAHLTADPDTGWTAAHGAAASGELRAIEALLAAGVHPNEVMAQDARGQTLVGVCEPTARATLRCLLRDTPDARGLTCAQRAWLQDAPEALQALKDDEVDVSLRRLMQADREGNTLLHRFAKNGAFESIERLKAAGLDASHLKLVNAQGRTPLYLAALHKEDENKTLDSLLHVLPAHRIGAWLLEKDTLGAAADTEGWNLAHLAVVRQNDAQLLYLLESGMRSLLLRPNDRGNTPLHAAAYRHQSAPFHLFRQFGGSNSSLAAVTNKKGQSIVQWGYMSEPTNARAGHQFWGRAGVPTWTLVLDDARQIPRKAARSIKKAASAALCCGGPSR